MSKSSNEFYEHLFKNLQSKMTPAQLKANNIVTSEDPLVCLLSLPLKDLYHDKFL